MKFDFLRFSFVCSQFFNFVARICSIVSLEFSAILLLTPPPTKVFPDNLPHSHLPLLAELQWNYQQ